MLRNWKEQETFLFYSTTDGILHILSPSFRVDLCEQHFNMRTVRTHFDVMSNLTWLHDKR